MRFRKTSEYAIKVLVYLSLHKNKLFSVNTLHQVLHIPKKYLSRLMKTLLDNGFVEVTKGHHGGYRVGRDMSSIYLYQILEVVEGLDDYKRCILEKKDCFGKKPCALHKFWAEHRDGIKKMIYTLTIEKIVQDYEHEDLVYQT